MSETNQFDYQAAVRRVEAAEARLRKARSFHPSKLQRRRGKDGSAQVFEAVAEWRRAIEEAYPPGFLDDYERLRRHDPAGAETAIRFLEADPWFFRSGYAKSKLLRYLGQIELDESQRRRLSNVMIAAVRGRDSREFRDYCRF